MLGQSGLTELCWSPGRVDQGGGRGGRGGTPAHGPRSSPPVQGGGDLHHSDIIHCRRGGGRTVVRVGHGLHSLHTELVGVLLVQVVVQHGDDGGGGVGDGGDTLGGGEEVSGGDDDGGAPPVSLLVSDGDQPGSLTGLAGPAMSPLSLASPHLTTNYQLPTTNLP